MSADQDQTRKPDPHPAVESETPPPANRFKTQLLLPRGGRAQGFLSNVRDLFVSRHAKLAPASGNRVQWVKDENFSRSQVASLTFHGGIGILLLFLALSPTMPPPLNNVIRTSPIFAPPSAYKPLTAFHPHLDGPGRDGGGGGARELAPASKGQTPLSGEQIVAPSVHTNRGAVLLLPPTVDDNVQNRVIDPNFNWGLVDGDANTISDGKGCCRGMGDNGAGSGAGNGKGPGAEDGVWGGGGDGGLNGRGVAAIRYPTCAFCPRPDYSDEARLAKYQGSVLLNVVVLPDGKAGEIEIVKGVGMGLDEKAIAAVRGWQFTPALGRDGRPMALAVTVEVVFSLY
jgi:periplasmic protein TonB